MFRKLGFYGEIVVLYYKIVDQWLNFSFFIAGEQEFIALSRRKMMWNEYIISPVIFNFKFSSTMYL